MYETSACGTAGALSDWQSGLKLRCVYLQSDIWYNLEFISGKKELELKDAAMK